MEAFLENIYFGPWDACIFEVAPALALSALLVMLWSWREGGREVSSTVVDWSREEKSSHHSQWPST